MRVLGIETSCDETGIAIFDQYQGLISNKVYSQYILHSDYGGVVPELAAREHVVKVVPLILSALKESCLAPNNIHGIAYTAGPGLIGALLVGATIATTLAYAWNIPIIDVHHMEAHLLTPMLEKKVLDFPLIALLVSGGHTQLILVHNMGRYEILGESVDDAVGEVFDKIAVLLGLQYPGGYSLSQLAKKGRSGRYVFPRPMIRHSGLDFSFSGLKTCVAKIIMSSATDQQNRADIARAFEDAIVETLVIKCKRALDYTGLKRLVVSGGVSSNYLLRTSLQDMIKIINGKLFFPKPELCTDNGAMVAYTGFLRLQSGQKSENLSVLVRPIWSLEKLSCIKLKKD